MKIKDLENANVVMTTPIESGLSLKLCKILMAEDYSCFVLDNFEHKSGKIFTVTDYYLKEMNDLETQDFEKKIYMENNCLCPIIKELPILQKVFSYFVFARNNGGDLRLLELPEDCFNQYARFNSIRDYYISNTRIDGDKTYFTFSKKK